MGGGISSYQPRRVVASFLVAFLAVIPVAPCFANCCCDGDTIDASSSSQKLAQPATHCHEGESDQQPEALEASHHHNTEAPSACGVLSSSCPCPEVFPRALVADNTGTKDTLTKLQMGLEHLSVYALEVGPLDPVFDSPSQRLPVAREPLYLRLGVFRI